MRKLLFAFAGVMLLSGVAALAISFGSNKPIQITLPKSAAPLSAGAATEVIVLSERNSVTFRGVVTPKKVAELQVALMTKSRSLSSDETIYLVMDTPGGSIGAGNEFIDTVQSLPQTVKTITVFAASMGFQIVQNLDERLILPNGTLMSHRAKFGGLEGEVPGELLVQLNFWLKILHRMDSVVAERMGMDVAQYQELIRDEYWVSGEDAVSDKAADRVVLARCDESLMGTQNELLLVFMGIKVYGLMSKCPVITGILDITLGGGGEEAQRQQALEKGFLYRDQRSSFINYAR